MELEEDGFVEVMDLRPILNHSLKMRQLNTVRYLHPPLQHHHTPNPPPTRHLNHHPPCHILPHPTINKHTMLLLCLHIQFHPHFFPNSLIIVISLCHCKRKSSFFLIRVYLIFTFFYYLRQCFDQNWLFSSLYFHHLPLSEN